MNVALYRSGSSYAARGLAAMENPAKTEVLRVRAAFEPFYALIALALVLIGGAIAGVLFCLPLLAI
jgi:hypothetical protein